MSLPSVESLRFGNRLPIDFTSAPSSIGEILRRKLRTVATTLTDIQTSIQKETGGVIPGHLIYRLGFYPLQWCRLNPDSGDVHEVYIGLAKDEFGRLHSEKALGTITVVRSADSDRVVRPAGIKVAGVCEDLMRNPRIMGVEYDTSNGNCVNRIGISLTEEEFGITQERKKGDFHQPMFHPVYRLLTHLDSAAAVYTAGMRNALEQQKPTGYTMECTIPEQWVGKHCLLGLVADHKGVFGLDIASANIGYQGALLNNNSTRVVSVLPVYRFLQPVEL